MYFERQSASAYASDSSYSKQGPAIASGWRNLPAVGATAVHVPFLDDAQRVVVERPGRLYVHALPSYSLNRPIEATLRFEDGEWIAEALHIPVYGCGDTSVEARDMLARELESLWDDLNDGHALGGDWVQTRRMLARLIAH